MTDTKRIWLVVILLSITIFHPVNVQFAMPFPMYPPPPPPPPPPMFAIPPPQPIQVAVLPMAFQMGDDSTTTTTTTTTTERNIAIAVPVPVPMPVQIAVPAYPPPSFCIRANPRPKACPPCPPCICYPSCTPAFFSYCSPCHQRCRCRDPNEAPIPIPPMPPHPVPGPAFPIPMPMPPGPPSVVVLPYPPQQSQNPRYSEVSSSSSSSEEEKTSGTSSSSESERRRRYKGFRRLRKKASRSGLRTRKQTRLQKRQRQRQRQLNNRRMSVNRHKDTSGNELVRPMLTYISRNGDIKLQKKISVVDAAELMGKGQLRRNNEGREVQTIQVMTKEDPESKSQMLVVSNDVNHRQQEDQNHQRYMVHNNVQSSYLREGRKEMVFKPPKNKKITNFSVSFQVS